MSTRDRLQSLRNFEDTLEPVGIAVGTLIALIGLATIVGMPWTNKNSVVLMIGQILGGLGTAGIGAGLVWLVRSQD